MFRKLSRSAEAFGILCGVTILTLLAIFTPACTGPTQTTTGYIEWNIQPSTTPNANATPQRPPTPPTTPR